MEPIARIHHLSATVGDPNENLQFYRDILGLRLVKKTVNFEDDGTYHLYFSNENADSGSIMTFFPRVDNLQGRVGAGQVRTIAFSIPKNSIAEWKEHLDKYEIDYTEENALGESSIRFNDFHGLSLALVESKMEATNKNILGFHGVELLSENPAQTFQLLVNEMGLQLIRVEPEFYLLEMTGHEKHKVLINRNFTQRGRLGIGTVHHIAWSVPEVNELALWKNHFDMAYKVTDVKDRKYFESVYFKDPGHIIYELATVGPGFTVDEPIETLGTELMLPEKYEAQREEIEAKLPKLNK